MTIKRFILLMTINLGCLAWVSCFPPVHSDELDDDQAGDDDDTASDDDTGGGMNCGDFCAWEDDLCVNWGDMQTNCLEYCNTGMNQGMLNCMETCPPNPSDDGCNCLYACFKR